MKYDVEMINEVKTMPDIDVYMTTYEHSKYISKAIESVIMQKTNYKYRLVILDDASTDGTQDIVRKYQERYPDRIVLALNKKNCRAQYAKQVYMSLALARYACHLEGDDYWIDPHKIEKQVCFLEKHPEYVAVAGNVMNINEDGSKQHCDFDLYSFKESHIFEKKNVLNMEMVAHISTITYRNFRKGWKIDDYEKFYKCKMNGDQKYSAILGMLGKTYYSHEVYSHHRRAFNGTSWTARTHGKNNAELNITMWEDLQRYIFDLYGEKIDIERCVADWKMQIGKPVICGKNVDEFTKRRNVLRMMDMWLLCKNGEKSISNLLSEKGIHKIAIYGMAELGTRLYFELNGTDVEAVYGIDKYASVQLPKLKIYDAIPENKIKIDAIIVTALTTYDYIKEELIKAGYGNVISLDELLYQMIPPDCFISEV